jgi:hypothetical protein
MISNLPRVSDDVHVTPMLDAHVHGVLIAASLSTKKWPYKRRADSISRMT